MQKAFFAKAAGDLMVVLNVCLLVMFKSSLKWGLQGLCIKGPLLVLVVFYEPRPSILKCLHPL